MKQVKHNAERKRRKGMKIFLGQRHEDDTLRFWKKPGSYVKVTLAAEKASKDAEEKKAKVEAEKKERAAAKAEA